METKKIKKITDTLGELERVNAVIETVEKMAKLASDGNIKTMLKIDIEDKNTKIPYQEQEYQYSPPQGVLSFFCVPTGCKEDKKGTVVLNWEISEPMLLQMLHFILIDTKKYRERLVKNLQKHTKATI